MQPIPLSLRKEMSNDPFYWKCCLTGKGNVKFHHNFCWKGKQLSEKWCILPLNVDIHKIEKRKDIKEKLNWIMCNKADNETLKKYSRATDLIWMRDSLNKKFGKYDPTKYV